jgi:hypothetical protein
MRFLACVHVYCFICIFVGFGVVKLMVVIDKDYVFMVICKDYMCGNQSIPST